MGGKFRVQHYLDRETSSRVLWMARQEWHALQPEIGRPVQIDVAGLPISGVGSDASVLAAVAARESTNTAQVDVFRYDENDHPTPVNRDTYVVEENILGRPDYQSLVIGSSTSDTPPLRTYLEEHVGFVKVPSTTDHWLSEVPSSGRSIIESRSSSFR